MITVILGLLVIVLDLWAFISILGSGASVLAKLLWFLLVLFFPVGGFIIWYLLGPRAE